MWLLSLPRPTTTTHNDHPQCQPPPSLQRPSAATSPPLPTAATPTTITIHSQPPPTMTTMRLATSQARQAHVQRHGTSTNVLRHLAMMTRTAHENGDDHNQPPPPTSDAQHPFTATGDDIHHDRPLPTSGNDHPATKTPHHRNPQNGDKHPSPAPTNHKPSPAKTATTAHEQWQAHMNRHGRR